MWMAIAILVLAWAIRSVCDDLGTSIYLVGVAVGLSPLRALPLGILGIGLFLRVFGRPTDHGASPPSSTVQP